MMKWTKEIEQYNNTLHLKSSIIAVKRFEKAEALESIEGLEHPTGLWTYCMVPHWVRKEGKIIGFTLSDFQSTTDGMGIGTRCMRIQGLAPNSKEALEYEGDKIMGNWFTNEDETMKHMYAYPTPPKAEAIVMAPLEKATFEPDYVLVYGDAAQMCFLMNGLQHNEYERYTFHFTGEGSCADALPQAAITGKPALSIPCLGERMRGHVADSEMVIAIPINQFAEGAKGMAAMGEKGFTMISDMPAEVLEQQPRA